MRAGNRERTALRRRRGGALSFESAALLVLVASMAVAGLFSLGGAMDRAIGGGARPAGFVAAPHDVPPRTAPLAAQAGIASAMDEAAEFARRASRGTGEVAPDYLQRAKTYSWFFGDATPWIGDARRPINLYDDAMNCTACALALDSTLEGRPASALPVGLRALEGGEGEFFAQLLADQPRVNAALALARRRIRAGVDRIQGFGDTAEVWLAELAGLEERPAGLLEVSEGARAAVASADILPLGDPDAFASELGRRAADWQRFPSLLELDQAVGAWPDRAKGAVMVEGPDGLGHVFNVLRYRGETYFLDGQWGIGRTRASFANARAFALRTDDVPVWVDLDALDLPPPANRFGHLKEEIPDDYFANPEFVNPRGRGARTFVQQGDGPGQRTVCAREVNCAKVTTATDQMLGGSGPTQALPVLGDIGAGARRDEGNVQVMLEALGVRSGEMNILTEEDASVAGVVKQVRQFGGGAKAFLWLEFDDANAHFLNVAKVDGTVVVIDNQGRRTAEDIARQLDGAKQIWVIRTRNLPMRMQGTLREWIDTKPAHALVVGGSAG
jgi:hypothetical protein